MKSNIYNEKSIFKAVLMAGLPSMLAQVSSLIYNLADTYFIAATNDPEKISAVVLCTPFILIVMSFGLIFGAGSCSAISRKLGEGDRSAARKAASFASYSSLFTGVIIMIAGLIFIGPLARVLGADSGNYQHTVDYMRFLLLGSIPITIANNLKHMIRGVAMIKQATIGAIFGNAVNIVLDYVFISLLKMGTAGAALATSIGFVFEAAYMLICVYKAYKGGEEILSFSFKYYGFNKMALEVLKIGCIAAMVTLMLSVANIVLNNFLSNYGSECVACYGIGYKLNMIPIMLAVGLSQGVGPLYGYNYGAKNYDRLRKSMKISLGIGIALGAFFLIIFLVFREFLCSIFLADPDLNSLAATYLVILCCSAPMVYPINIVTQYYQNIGKALPALIITVLRNVVVFLILIIILNLLFKDYGVVAAQPATEVVLGVVCLIMYFISAKKLGKIRKNLQ